MDFRQFFVPNSQPSKAVPPCPGALHDPAIAPQPLAWGNPPPRDAGLYASAAKLIAQYSGVVRLVRVQLRRAPSRSAPSLTDPRNGVNAAQHHSGIVHVGSALHDREREAVGFDHTMARVVPDFPRSVGFAPVCAPFWRRHGKGSHRCAAPIELGRIREVREQNLVQLAPDASALPLAAPAPASCARSAAHLLGQPGPGDSCPQDKDDAAQCIPARDAGTVPFGLKRCGR
jgi:hypothetical protein